MVVRTALVLGSLSVAFLTSTGASAASAAAQSERVHNSPPHAASVAITAAVVLSDMTVRPLPLLGLELTSGDQADTISAHTELDGRTTQSVAPGSYHLRSTTPVQLEGKSYAWNIAFTVPAGGTTKVDLTNLNATATSIASVPARQIAPGRAVFEKVRRGVFRVEAGLGHGSGFLIADDGGLVVTNEHVLAGETEASVYLDSATRVPAQIVVRDRDADLALLRIPTGRCSDCPRLPLRHGKPGEPIVVEGESVIAIGVPLHQEITLTAGIASSVRKGAIISDVNVNHGNSGGPMLNMAGEVIGVNTFMDLSRAGGPGISGAITVDRLLPLLRKVPAALAALPSVENRLLPTMPLTTYPMPLLKAFADSAQGWAYDNFSGRDAGRFWVTLISPTSLRVLQKEEETNISKDRRAREEKGGVPEDARYSEVRELHDWEQYIGDDAAPVVSFLINPKIAGTFWSSGREWKFLGDVRGARFYRNGVEVEPLRGGHGPHKVEIRNQWVELKDVADRGYYVLPPELFEPGSTGAPPMVSVVVQDLKNPKELSSVDIWGQTSARVWNDFEPYYTAIHPGARFHRANPRLTRKVKLECDPRTGDCKLKTSRPAPPPNHR